MNFIEELRWRGMLHDMIPGLEEHLQKELTTAYIGFDPTAPSLHIGNLAAIMLLKHFQLAGHKPIALVGGATGMIGDPSGKSAERDFLSEETLRENQIGIKAQLEKFLDFECGATSAEVVNNYDWFKEFSFLGFLREAGKFLTVNYMMSKDSVQKRLETGLSFTEFSYQLLQGYDFYHLYKTKNVRLQMGGSDQWGNITTGTEIIRRKTEEDNDDRAYALTTPLVTKADGSKFGKSESGNVWLDASKTSPYQFYQFWLNAADADCARLIRVFTLFSKQDIEAMEKEHADAPHLRILQKAIAEEVTTRVHGAAITALVNEASGLLFSKDAVELLANASEELLAQLPVLEVASEDLLECNNLTDLVSVGTKNIIFSSKGDARKAIQGNALSVNKVKVTDPQTDWKSIDKIRGKYVLVGNGKQKNYLLLFK
ncbi:tyrosine--tRNA ligase [Sandaracinomonas limnophila]|uniref:Tyrosine--tRNA ligase n=1 Tax=Sandaracinomonas limnophila TaxID=1862386 RepID=A0A437PS28_9BACT|nr:tyrosine--tRNA ligase [Sandaracinomonas limnophila]RVU25078.1 tyrosine--tRNA ligase [Sandaracinomonas limnophila]